MKIIRRHNDIHFVWHIFRGQYQEDFTDKNVIVKLLDKDNHAQKIEYTLGNGVVEGVFYGKDQCSTGAMRLLLIENPGEKNQNTLDYVDAFCISAKLKNTTQQGNYPSHLEVETADLTSYIVDAGGGTYKQPPYSHLVKHAPLLHEIWYDKLDYDYAEEYFKGSVVDNVGGCSSIFDGQYFGRDYDWYKPIGDDEVDRPEFVVHTPRTTRALGSLGVATIDGITEKMADEHTDSELWKILPFYMMDGVNEAGVCVNVNVVPRDKGENTTTIPAIETYTELNSKQVVRYVLDNFQTAQQAVEHLRDYTAITINPAMIEMGYDVHWMIGDKNHCYVVEIIDNVVVITEHNKMTNFHIDGVEFNEDGSVWTNADVADGHKPTDMGITPYGAGLERYNILNNGIDADSVRDVLYYQTYDLPTEWFSEFVMREYGVTVDTPTDDETLQAIIEAAQEIKRGEREGRLWNTNHSCIYDIENKTVDLKSFEDGDYFFIMDYRSIPTFNDLVDVLEASMNYTDEAISEIDLSDYTTYAYIDSRHFLTEHQSLDGYATESYVADYVAEHGADLSSYVTKQELEDDERVIAYHGRNIYKKIEVEIPSKINDSYSNIYSLVYDNNYKLDVQDDKLYSYIKENEYVVSKHINYIYNNFLKQSDIDEIDESLSYAMNGVMHDMDVIKHSGLVNNAKLIDYVSAYTHENIDPQIYDLWKNISYDEYAISYALNTKATFSYVAEYVEEHGGSSEPANIIEITEAEYEALPEKEPNSLYIISDDTSYMFTASNIISYLSEHTALLDELKTLLGINA